MNPPLSKSAPDVARNLESPEPSTKLYALAAVYRAMPYGGALLSIESCPPSFVVADGVTIKASFTSRRAARKSLKAAGFYEQGPNQWKVRFTLPCGCRIDDQLLCTHGNSQLA